jgi:hypothetical protein
MGLKSIFSLNRFQSSSDRTTKVQLVGGLGNQLFCYTFGLYLEKICGHEVVFDTSEIDRGYTKHGVSIESYDLPGIFKNVRLQNGIINYALRRVSFALQARLPRLKLLKAFYPCYTATEVGWDPDHERIAKGSTARGYFASSKYFDALKKQGTLISLKPISPSVFFNETLTELTSSRFLSVHVRRGDYVGLADKYGLVGRQYFCDALSLLEKEPVVWDRVVVFSDDVEAAKKLLEGVFDRYKVLFLDPPIESDASESLALMTNASCHIVSNSSFSLWGALLSENGGLVVAPEPWHKGMPEPNQLLPATWKKAGSDFLE